MKKISLLLTLSFFCFLTYAQTSGGPDAFGYTWKSSHHSVNPPSYQWVDISQIGTQVIGMADDNILGPFTVPNSFRYYWYSPSLFWIGSNGYINFDGSNISSGPTGFPASIPLSSGANDFIAPLMTDLNFSNLTGPNPGVCYYYSNSDSLIISFEEVPYWISPVLNGGLDFTGQNSFQIILNGADSSITFNYIFLDLGNQTLIDNLIGIENITGAIGLNPFTDSLLPDTFSIKFYYPPAVTYSVTDGGVNWVGNDKTGGDFAKKDGVAQPLFANVKNFGNTNLTGFLVLDTVFDSAGNAVTNGSATVASLAPGNDVTLNFSNTFAPTATGTYFFRTYLSGISGDLVATNNMDVQEIIVVDTTSIMILDYSDASPNGAGLGWNGGDGGIAVYIKPPIYPAKILSSRFYISANASPAVGFHAKIYADDGPNGEHGTLLDSIFRAGSSITNNTYTYISHETSNIVIDSGGIYLLWDMDGNGINLARDIDLPISRRSIEVLSGGWGGYRGLLTEDFLMGIRIDYAWPRAAFNVSYALDPEINFIDQSTNDPVTWYWTFGDGDTSTAQNPSHIYDENKKYEVCLAVSNFYGSDTVCDSIEVTKVFPTAFFTYNDSAFPTIAFKDESFGSPTAWQWNLADTAGPIVSIQNPIYRFRNNGMRNVCLTAINANGSSAPYCEEIEIYGIGIEEHNLIELSVQPNPFNSEAVVVLPEYLDTKNLSIRTISMIGAEVDLPYKIEKNRILLRGDQLKAGTYLIQVLDEASPVAFLQVVIE